MSAALDLEKVTIRLHRGDKDEIQRIHPELGHNAVIREIVHAWVRKEKHARSLRSHATQNLTDEDLDLT